MSLLKKRLAEILPAQAEKMKAFAKEHGEKVVGEVTLGQAFGGMRGIKGIVCDTSEVPPQKGLIIRGIEINDLVDKLPEEIFWLLLTGSLPNQEELTDLQNDIKSRQGVPDYVWNVIDNMPASSHPMTMLNTAILVMQNDSKFANKYEEGMKKSDYWEYTLEDALDIVAKIPAIAAYVYRKKFNKGPRIEADPNADWSGNYVHMLGMGSSSSEFADLMRLYLTLHSDHEGGNVSAFTARTVNSALSDLYYSLSAGLNGLAGPLHGLANQECLGWLLETIEQFGGRPTKEQLEKMTWDTLNAGQVVPGYGHAVLRVTDPRFTAFYNFGVKRLPNDDIFQTVVDIYDVVPKVLSQVEKIQNPWPNVDAISGSLLYHYGLTEFSYYTVLFSVSRALGICAQSIVALGQGQPITRPKSLPSAKFMEIASAN